MSLRYLFIVRGSGKSGHVTQDIGSPMIPYRYMHRRAFRVVVLITRNHTFAGIGTYIAIITRRQVALTSFTRGHDRDWGCPFTQATMFVFTQSH